MASGSVVPVWAPVTAAAVVGTALAVAVNFATGGGPWWLWVLVAVLTVAGVATSLWLHRRQSTPPHAGTMTASGERSVVVDGTVTSPIRTGDRGTPASVTPPAAPPPPASAPVPGSATASGPRSVVVRGTAGEIVTGDEHTPPPSP